MKDAEPQDGVNVVEQVPEAASEVFGTALPQVEAFAQLLTEQGELRGLIGPRELPRLWSRHLVNSAAVSPFLPATGAVADVGSGAGFPGIVLAAMHPELHFHLIEPMERRVDWLVEVVEHLDLKNVTVQRARVEELHRKLKVEAATARAVANMSKLTRMCFPLLRRGGYLIALKGIRAEEELAGAQDVLRRFGAGSITLTDMHSPTDGSTTVVVEIEKASD